MSAEAKTTRKELQNTVRVNKTRAALASKAGDHSAATGYSVAADEALARLLSDE
jgi:hypothetical protein